MGSPVNFARSFTRYDDKQLGVHLSDERYHSVKDLRKRLEQETRRDRSRAVNPAEIALKPRINSSNVPTTSTRTGYSRPPARKPSSQPAPKTDFVYPLSDVRVRVAQQKAAAAMATPNHESRLFRERQVTAAISWSAIQTPSAALEWCGIPLGRAFMCATNRKALAPEEHKGIFKNKNHARQYGKLVRALERVTGCLKLQQQDDLKAERARCQTDRERESNEFHTEFLERLSWGQPGCVLSLDPDNLKTYMNRLGKEKLDSNFPTINQYFRKFPTMGIAWAVDDFYKRQQTRYLENENLLRIKHLWDLYETHYNFLHAVHLLQKEHESTLRSWFSLFNGESQPAGNAQGTASETVEWSPKKDEERKMLQFTTVKRIWTICKDSGLEFPLDFCPGGTTPMVHFKCMGELRSVDLDFRNPKTLFLRSHVRFDKRSAEGLEVAGEIERMLSNHDTPQEYYKLHPYALGNNVIWDCHSIRDDTNEDDVTLRHPSDDSETTSLNFDDLSSVDYAEGTQMPGTYPASASGRIESTPFKRKDGSLGWNEGWRSVRAGWPLGLRA